MRPLLAAWPLLIFGVTGPGGCAASTARTQSTQVPAASAHIADPSPVAVAPAQDVEQSTAAQPHPVAGSALPATAAPDDLLRERALTLYKAKMVGWFNVRFDVRSASVPCPTERRLFAAARLKVDPDRWITGARVTSRSGNKVFDELVDETLRKLVGQRIPPPSPFFGDQVPGELNPVFSNAGVVCR